MGKITNYHNPAGGTSRNTLAMIRSCGQEPEVFDYLQHPPDRAILQSLIAAMGCTVRDLLRVKGRLCETLGLNTSGGKNHELPIDAILDLPSCYQRINNTGVLQRESTWVATEPNNRPPIAPRPCVPIIKRSNFPCCASLAMFAAADPIRRTHLAWMPCSTRNLRTGASTASASSS
jgi:arsenate reductase (glutaredoxin)